MTGEPLDDDADDDATDLGGDPPAPIAAARPAELDAGWLTPAALAQAVGTALPPTPWTQLSPEMVRRFARLTGDDQDLHGADGRRGPGILVQGALLVAVATALLHGVYRLPWAQASYQTGYDRLRFRGVVAAGTAVRLHPTPARLRGLKDGRYRLETQVALESAAHARPVLTGRFLALIVPHDTAVTGASSP
jgi:acyl dehydratase